MGQMRNARWREAAECLMSNRLPSHSGVAFEVALLSLIAANEGRKDAAQDRLSLTQLGRQVFLWIGN